MQKSRFDGQALLERIIDEKLLTARGAYGFWPAASQGEDVILYAEDGSGDIAARFSFLRQQTQHVDERPNLSLADYVAPQNGRVPDYVGAYAVTAGIGAEELAREYEAAHDDYHAIMTKALADRLAEAFAEYLRCFRDPATIHATCEDYRAGATIDLVHDDADGGRAIDCPLLVLWGSAGKNARHFDFLSIWRERANDARGRGLDCGHFLAEEAPDETLAALSEYLVSD